MTKLSLYFTFNESLINTHHKVEQQKILISFNRNFTEQSNKRNKGKAISSLVVLQGHFFNAEIIFYGKIKVIKRS